MSLSADIPKLPIPLDHIEASLNAPNQAILLQTLAARLGAGVGINPRILLDRLSREFEKNGTVPHDAVCVLSLYISGLNAPYSTFITMKNTSSLDMPRMLYVVLLPERNKVSFLPMLARICRFFSHKTILEKLRAAPDDHTLHLIFTQKQDGKLAA